MPETTPYVKQTHVDGGSFSGAKATYMEEGIRAAHEQPAVRVYHNANQAIVTATDTVLAFNSERFDTAFGSASTQHDTVTNNSRLTCRYAGKYDISANIRWEASAVGLRELKLRLNGTTIIAFDRREPVSASVMVVSIATLWDLAINDYVEVIVRQESGANRILDAFASYSPEFMWARVG